MWIPPNYTSQNTTPERSHSGRRRIIPDALTLQQENPDFFQQLRGSDSSQEDIRTSSDANRIEDIGPSNEIIPVRSKTKLPVSDISFETMFQHYKKMPTPQFFILVSKEKESQFSLAMTLKGQFSVLKASKPVEEKKLSVKKIQNLKKQDLKQIGKKILMSNKSGKQASVPEPSSSSANKENQQVMTPDNTLAVHLPLDPQQASRLISLLHQDITEKFDSNAESPVVQTFGYGDNQTLNNYYKNLYDGRMQYNNDSNHLKFETNLLGLTGLKHDAITTLFTAAKNMLEKHLQLMGEKADFRVQAYVAQENLKNLSAFTFEMLIFFNDTKNTHNKSFHKLSPLAAYNTAIDRLNIYQLLTDQRKMIEPEARIDSIKKDAQQQYLEFNQIGFDHKRDLPDSLGADAILIKGLQVMSQKMDEFNLDVGRFDISN